MRVMYPLDGVGCRVVVSRGFLEGFCDDRESCKLRGLEGVTFFLDENFRMGGVQFRNGQLKQWQGEDLGELFQMAQEKAQDEQPHISGVRLRSPELLKAIQEPPTTALEAPSPTTTTLEAPVFLDRPKPEYRHPHVVVRQRKL